ncbi:MAG: hypothetical protein QXT13_07810 [Pyrobaculum sp.]
MPKPKRYPAVEGLDVLRDVFLSVECPHCGYPGVLSPRRAPRISRRFNMARFSSILI